MKKSPPNPAAEPTPTPAVDHVKTLTDILALANECRDEQLKVNEAFYAFQREHKNAMQRLNLSLSKLESLAAIARDMSTKKGD